MNDKHHDAVKRGIEAGAIPPTGVICLADNVGVNLAMGEEENKSDFGGSPWAWQDIIAPQTEVLRYDWWNGIYYAIDLTDELMSKIVANFKGETNMVPWHLGHSWRPESYGWTRSFRRNDGTIQGETSYTADTVPLVKAGKYMYVSAELSYASLDEAKDPESQASHMTGIALVNSPAIRSMNEVSLKLGLHGFSAGDPNAKTRTQIVNNLEKENGMPKEKAMTQEQCDALLAELKAARAENFAFTAETKLKEQLGRGATSPANIEAYQELLEESATPQHDLDIMLAVLANNPDNSVVDLSENKSEPGKKEPDLDKSGDKDTDNGFAEQEKFIHKRIEKLTDGGMDEYKAFQQAKAEYEEQANADEDGEYSLIFQ